jgi:Fe(3+) dicitrate transport protein
MSRSFFGRLFDAPMVFTGALLLSATPVLAQSEGSTTEGSATIVSTTEDVAPAKQSEETVEAEATPAPEATTNTEATPAPEAAPSKTVVVNPEAMESYSTTVAGTTLAKTPGSASVMKSKQLERMNYDDPNAVVTSVPGVYARGEDGLGLRPNIGIRGVNPDRSKKITLLEDGIPFAPAPYAASAAYYFPLITRMSQVKVLKGPAAIAYGPHTVAGAIDLITRAIPFGTAAGVDLAGGQYGYGKAHVYAGHGNEQLGFLIEGVHLQSSGFKELPHNGGDRPNTGFVRNEWMAKASYLLDPSAKIKNEFKLKLTYSDETSNETYLGLTDEDFKKDPNQRYAATALDRMRNHRTSIALTHELRPSSQATLSTSVYRHDFSRVWRKVNRFGGASLFDVLSNPTAGRNPDFIDLLRGGSDSSTESQLLWIGPNEREFVSQGLLSRLRLDGETGALAHRFEAGLHFHNDSIARRHSEDAFRLEGGVPVPAERATSVTAYNEESANAFSAHAVDAVTWKKLTLTGGLRFEAMQLSYLDKLNENKLEEHTAVAVLPSVGAFYSFTDSFGLLAGVFRGFSPPAPSAGVNAKPELSLNYEAGARYTQGKAQFELIGYYNDYSNLTDNCTESAGCSGLTLDKQFNAGEARIYGLEAYARHEVPVGIVKIPFSLAYTFTQTEFLNDFTSDDPIFGVVKKGFEIPYVPKHQVSAMAGVEGKRAGANVNLTYVSQMREVAGKGPMSQTLATDEQFLVDVSASVKVYKAIVLYANARNLLNSQYIVSRRPFGARPNAPRWIQIGTKVEF